MPLFRDNIRIGAVGDDYPRDKGGADGIGLGNVQE